MKLAFENESGTAFKFDLKDTAERVIAAALDYVGLQYDVELSLLVTDDETIREINRKNRRYDSATDVLSFPAIDYPSPKDFSILEKDGSLFNPENGCLLLGDIVVNATRVRSQAADYGHSELREYSFLIVHSVLHLIGYDHADEAGEKEMFAIQKEILNNLGITR